ncbi:MAG TPA: sigma factor-like helix-turn-helix DNA-binding protein [Candidatus Dormibacteraeota bacterium]|nr:sigma factor-like helix-turn-helix DNA-binding protein [Candidatus Dormibacteraeota bacterium]
MTPLSAPDPTALVAHHQRLLDVYGALLTEHQREACRLHLDEDWSFAELAQELGVSRSAAHDLVRRALVQLEHYEARLGHAAELARRDAVEADLRAQLSRSLPAGPATALAPQARS